MEMARRRKRRFGATSDVHHDRATSSLREIKRLTDRVRSYLKSPPDCDMAAGLVVTLSELRGAYLIDRFEGGRGRGGRAGSYGGRGPRAVIDKFISKCIVKPKTAAAARKMRAVWR
jgi:hypothetical protein